MARNIQTKAWSQEVSSLRSTTIDNTIELYSDLISDLSRKFNLDRRYVEIQVRIHMPYYNFDTIDNKYEAMNEIIDRIYEKASTVRDIVADYRDRCGIDWLPIDGKVIGGTPPFITSHSDRSINIPITFDIVENRLGTEIQNKLHYIHSARTDTLNHFGFFLPGAAFPFCYAAVSLCDRNYQYAALQKVIPSADRNKVLNMTRAFSIPPLPQNSMSKLFEQIAKFYQDKKHYDVIITALNPLLGFKGATFLGSSYIPFASSPMGYFYDKKGMYLNRRSTEEFVAMQQMKTPPILWLARGLTRPYRRILDGNQQINPISLREYQAG